MYMYVCIYIYIYIYAEIMLIMILILILISIIIEGLRRRVDQGLVMGLLLLSTRKLAVPWLWTNGVNTNGAAAKVMNFVRLGKRYALALLGRDK